MDHAQITTTSLVAFGLSNPSVSVRRNGEHCRVPLPTIYQYYCPLDFLPYCSHITLQHIIYNKMKISLCVLYILFFISGF